MSRTLLIPKLAFTGIRKNGVVYLPYILTTSFSIALLFIFSCITKNPLLENVPHSGYAVMLLMIGKVLLGMILIPFLFYTNSFLIKRRKKEMGLYTVLGLEKKHVGFMMILETVMIYLFSTVAGLLTAAVFGKLVFAFMLRSCSLPVSTKFTMDAGSLYGTVVFFGIVFLLNLISNLWQVTMVNPTELLRGSRKGEKEPKHLVLFAVIGLAFLGLGYYLTFTCELDSMIFIKFLFAVMVVVIGTYFTFTSGSILFLKILKKKKTFYYKKENYICISGMLYRMKKSAASLVNICIFSTMVIITLLCTFSLRLGEEDAIRFYNPFDFRYNFAGSDDTAFSGFENSLVEKALQHHVEVTDFYTFPYGSVDEIVDGNCFTKDKEEGLQENQMTVRLLTLSDYNRIEQTSETLSDGEALFYSTVQDFGQSEVTLNGISYKIKKELTSLRTDLKEEMAMANRRYYMIVKDMDALKAAAGDNIYYSIIGNLSGEEEEIKGLLKEMDTEFDASPNRVERRNYYDYGDQMRSLDGGLLFIGVFFSLLFSICLVLIMYYKQISEGFEDQDSFHIMKKVGMSDEDIRATIRKQILLVFALPLLTAVIHTICSMNMTICLLYTLNLFETAKMYLIAAGVIVAFLVFYGISYLITARTYYKIVK